MSRAFYEALGFEFRRELPIVRDGELEATNFFFGVPGQEEELELTFNHDGRSYELGWERAMATLPSGLTPRIWRACENVRACRPEEGRPFAASARSQSAADCHVAPQQMTAAKLVILPLARRSP
jgi:hypothetical protein